MKILKWTVSVLLVFVIIILGIYGKAVWSVDKRLSQKYKFTLPVTELHADYAILAEGRRLMITKGCQGCHGDDLGGKVWLDDALLGRIVAPNLTKGKGGLAKDYNANDWVRSLKHGLKRDSTSLKLMPSSEFTFLVEDDMHAIIAYCMSLHPIDRELPESSLGVLGYILTDYNQVPMIPAENIDHTRPLTKSIRREVSIEFGQYLAVACEGCHRKNMKGGAPVAPGFPEVADITSTGHPGNWTEQQFIEALKTGTTPEGKKLNPDEMPWIAFKDYTDVELKALFLYLQSL